ncbi:hypothetical protein DFH09DRAFT_1281463 [Mycena vulgaris]|nr:hypothetical protein DFH09DRAFT_1281463 [Mycena vulgaris]
MCQNTPVEYATNTSTPRTGRTIPLAGPPKNRVGMFGGGARGLTGAWNVTYLGRATPLAGLQQFKSGFRGFGVVGGPVGKSVRLGITISSVKAEMRCAHIEDTKNRGSSARGTPITRVKISTATLREKLEDVYRQRGQDVSGFAPARAANQFWFGSGLPDFGDSVALVVIIRSPVAAGSTGRDSNREAPGVPDILMSLYHGHFCKAVVTKALQALASLAPAPSRTYPSQVIKCARFKASNIQALSSSRVFAVGERKIIQASTAAHAPQGMSASLKLSSLKSARGPSSPSNSRARHFSLGLVYVYICDTGFMNTVDDVLPQRNSYTSISTYLLVLLL